MEKLATLAFDCTIPSKAINKPIKIYAMQLLIHIHAYDLEIRLMPLQILTLLLLEVLETLS